MTSELERVFLRCHIVVVRIIPCCLGFTGGAQASMWQPGGLESQWSSNQGKGVGERNCWRQAVVLDDNSVCTVSSGFCMCHMQSQRGEATCQQEV